MRVTSVTGNVKLIGIDERPAAKASVAYPCNYRHCELLAFKAAFNCASKAPQARWEQVAVAREMNEHKLDSPEH